MVIEVVAEFRPFLFFTADDGRHQVGVFPQIVAHFCQQGGVFRKALHQDIARAVESGFCVRYAVVGVDIFSGFGFRVVRGFVPQQIGQRFQPGFNGDLPARAALRLVRQIEIFELGFTQRPVDGFFQRLGQLALLADGLQDRLTTVFKFTQIAQAGFQITQLRVIQTAGDFFTIACDKRHGIPFIKQANGSFYLFSPGLKFTRNNAAERIIHHRFNSSLGSKIRGIVIRTGTLKCQPRPKPLGMFRTYLALTYSISFTYQAASPAGVFTIAKSPTSFFSSARAIGESMEM